MIQLFQIIISIITGLIYGIILPKIKKNLLLTLFTTTIITLLYIIFLYVINDGESNYLLKMNTILGYLLQNYVSNLYKKASNK